MELSRRVSAELGHAPPDPLTRLAIALDGELTSVETLLHDRAASPHTRRINDVARHLLDAGGKRIRPLLTLASARIVGDSPRAPLLAAAVEFIHTATLLHDDVVDRSARRRGQPTANLLWDNKSSVLVGDFFFARAFQLMVEADNLTALRILSDASATISEAEVMQLVMASNVEMEESTYIKIIEGKTAVLFAAATETGAVIAGASPEQARALSTYGHALGICFQIIDDLLDYGAPDAAIGKDTGDDFKERKITLPIIKAYGHGNEADRAFWRRIFSRLGDQDGNFEDARAALMHSGAIERTRASAAGWRDKALDALDLLPPTPMRDHLAEMAHYALDRTS